MAEKLVIVESPTKARTISQYLGKEYKVVASYGHVRDLPNSATEIPAEIKKEPWSRLGVNVDDDFRPLYIIPPSKKKVISELKDKIKNASELLLATDEDREGESISWHLVEVLKPKIPVKRLVFHEITKTAIKAAIDNPRDIDQALVRAQETRRIVDRLFGYSISPLLWKKMAPGLSAGRVQSVAMRLLVERERERIKFRSAEYWDVSAELAKNGSVFSAELTHVGELRVVSGKDFDPDTGKLKVKDKSIHLNEEQALKLADTLRKLKGNVLSVEAKPFTQRPSPPFTTSTLQQEGSRKLNFSAKHTMSVAQQLYEHGYITYMRTDSTTLSAEALEGARSLISREFGKEYLEPAPRQFQTKVKNAQEAHEAIRPAGDNFASFEEVKSRLGIEALRLYELIWKRTVASQMKDAQGTRVVVQIECGEAKFRASGKTLTFPGFIRAYVEGTDDPEAELADQEKVLPVLNQGDTVDVSKIDPARHNTQPPARFTEGSLIKELERLGIGRPSTWATVVDLVVSRAYAFRKGTALVPTFLAMALTSLMERFFTKLVDYQFTAALEDDLDTISRGEADNLKYLKSFYFGNGHPGVEKLVAQGLEKIDPREVNGIALGQDASKREVQVRIGRFGPFITNGENTASLNEATAPDEITLERALKILEEAARGPLELGKDPATSKSVYVKSGRFGTYIQLGEDGEGEEKPKRASLLAGMTGETVTFEDALALLSLPRVIGKNPENGTDITATNGRYGPYIQCGTETRTIPAEEDTPLTITLEKALFLLSQPRRRGRAAAAKPTAIKDLGKHPVTEKAVSVKSGRFGPYVTDGEINATIPKGRDPNDVTIEEAVHLLQARAERIAAGGGVKRRGRGSRRGAAEKKPKAQQKPAKKPSKKSKSKSTEEETPTQVE